MGNPVDPVFERAFGGAPALCARAPGRVEVIGNHTDYNGGTVIGAAIDRSVWVAIRARADASMVLVTETMPTPITVKGPIARQGGDAAWGNYPLGVLKALEKRGLERDGGFELAVAADLPLGAGLSSSAALELSSAIAFCEAFDLKLSRSELALACREAENEFVGVPCGILDQGVSAFGEADKLVHIDCRGPTFSVVPTPGGIHFWIFSTRQKHALIESLYSTRHQECMAAVVAVAEVFPDVKLLADIDSARLDTVMDRMPDAIGRRARHVVEEIERVGRASSAFSSGDLNEAGRLLLESHGSSRLLFENSTEELDYLVEVLAETPGVYGARLTGGGFGGAVMAMADESFGAEDAGSVGARFSGRFGAPAEIIHVRMADGASLCK
ncbi:MAG: galactokinase [Verrucomicrobia bacterium]|nr:MAG: galactokinase [Verrucomicrobiota bacterium]